MSAGIDRYLDDDEATPNTESLEVDELEASADDEELGDTGKI
jgi:hypothetical protein